MSVQAIPEDELEIRETLRDDFPWYAESCLRIRPKEGGVIPFVLNEVQHIVHNRIERQREETGRVRALILKARQPGISTYVEGRYYHKVTHTKGYRAFILTHKSDATENLFTMAERFHDNCPLKVKPLTGKSNNRELEFLTLDSGYKVGTAGARGVGRSETIQLFHGSEVAFWENAADHVAGALQAVPDQDGTEVILESTANGLGDLFYNMCKAAERGESEYQLIFVAWFDHAPYRAEAPEGWKAPEAFREYGELHDLDDDQIFWMHRTNQALAQSAGSPDDLICWLFRQEYPATAEEAFQTGGDETFIHSDWVYAARKNTVKPGDLPIVLGVDVARGGNDKTRIIDRQGRRLGGHINRTLDSDDTMHIAGVVSKIIDEVKPSKVNIDVTGVGAGVVDRLKETEDKRLIQAINFGGKPIDNVQWANKRAEMWGALRDWLADPAGVDIPDEDAMHTDFCSVIWGKGATRYNSNSQIILEPKDHIKERLGFSPDAGDAAALTFATPTPAKRKTLEYETDGRQFT